jgi:hypothetical protein
MARKSCCVARARVIPRPARSCLLIEREGTRLDLAGRHIFRQHHAIRKSSLLSKLEGLGHGAVAEQPLTLAEHERENQQAVFVDQLVFDLRLDKIRAALDQQFRAIAGLEFAKPGDDITA